ncbi:hypothetical protein BC941DRAFT_96555 [Chlamydoabsidia padenii]|nr:hypothetical protein BC941DRAFT_96555 [Chlamydoabsidia padenii]
MQNNLEQPLHHFYGSSTGAMYANPSTMLTNDAPGLNPTNRPPQLQQQQQGMYTQSPGMIQGFMGGDTTGLGLPLFTTPLQQQHSQLQLRLQQQLSLPTPTPSIVDTLSSGVSTTRLTIESTLVKTPAQKENLAQYQQRDQLYQDIINTQDKRHLLLAHEKKRAIETRQHEQKVRQQGAHGLIATFGPGYQGQGNSTTGMQNKIVYPQDKQRTRRTPLLKFSLDDMKKQSDKGDTLVPIRLEFDTDGYMLRDTFTWNLNEQLITAEQFAEQMCEDLRLPMALFVPLIAKSICDQVQDYSLHASSMMTNEISIADDDLNLICHQPATPIKTEPTSTDSQLNLNQVHDNDTKKSNPGAELRILIKLDITVGHKELIDQFEWDINCPSNSPETFAKVLSSDLGLDGEFRTAIAHSIREQVHVYIKSLLLVVHDFNGPVLDNDLKYSFLPVLNGTLRDGDTVERFTPVILELSEAELQKNEKDRLREAR